MDDLAEMLKLYPEMILISRSPHSWKGLLKVQNPCVNCQMKVKVKLIVPAFPQLENASVYFGGSIAHLFGAMFKRQIQSLIDKSESVSAFFQELIKTIVRIYSILISLLH
jgi:hypothetical protein